MTDERDSQERGEWQPIDTAPANTPVIVKVGECMTFAARLIPDGSMCAAEQSCDQWQAEHEGEHPECWHDGCCWESNADERMSLQPTHWQPLDLAKANLQSPEASDG